MRQGKACHRTVAVKRLHFRVASKSRTPALLAESRFFYVPVGSCRTARPENVYFVQTGCPVVVHVTARISRIDAVNQQARIPAVRCRTCCPPYGDIPPQNILRNRWA